MSGSGRVYDRSVVLLQRVSALTCELVALKNLRSRVSKAEERKAARRRQRLVLRKTH